MSLAQATIATATSLCRQPGVGIHLKAARQDQLHGAVEVGARIFQVPGFVLLLAGVEAFLDLFHKDVNCRPGVRQKGNESDRPIREGKRLADVCRKLGRSWGRRRHTNLFGRSLVAACQQYCAGR